MPSPIICFDQKFSSGAAFFICHIPKPAIANAKTEVSQSKSRRSRFSRMATMLLFPCGFLFGHYRTVRVAFSEIRFVNAFRCRCRVGRTKAGVFYQCDDSDLRLVCRSKTVKPGVVLGSARPQL